MTGLLKHEETLTCPYNPSHQILKSKMTVHLVRCRRSNLDKKVEICPFNSSHHVKKEDYDSHLRICKVYMYLSFYLPMVCIIYIQDRKLLEDFWNQPKPKKPVPVAAAKIPADAVEDEEEENWETDLLEHSYNPLEVAIRSLTFVS